MSILSEPEWYSESLSDWIGRVLMDNGHRPIIFTGYGELYITREAAGFTAYVLSSVTRTDHQDWIKSALQENGIGFSVVDIKAVPEFIRLQNRLETGIKITSPNVSAETIDQILPPIIKVLCGAEKIEEEPSPPRRSLQDCYSGIARRTMELLATAQPTA